MFEAALWLSSVDYDSVVRCLLSSMVETILFMSAANEFTKTEQKRGESNGRAFESNFAY